MSVSQGSGPMKWVSARHLQHFIAQAEASGISMDELLDEAGLVRARLDDPDYQVPLPVIELMLASITRQPDQTLIGLRMAHNIQPAELGPLGYLAQTCTTLADALDAAVRYRGLLSNIGRASVVPVPGGAELRWEILAGGRLFRQHAVEYLLGSLVLLARLLMPERQELPLSISFPHSRPDDPRYIREYIAFFKCPVYFDRSYACALLPTQVLQTRLRHGDAFMREILENHAEELLKKRMTTSSLSDEVCHLIRALMINSNPTKETVAAQLCISGRSLHRRLQEEGTSYRELLDQVRLEMTSRKLQAGTESIAEIAEQLGFSTRQAFLRWFKNHTGKTPSEYRE